MTKLEELTRGLIGLSSPVLKTLLKHIQDEEMDISKQNHIRVVKALQTIEEIKKLIEPNNPSKKWDQIKIDL